MYISSSKTTSTPNMKLTGPEARIYRFVSN